MVLRCGSFTDPRYGRFEINSALLWLMKYHFDQGLGGQDVLIDVAYRPEEGAAGKVVALSVLRNTLWADIEWTALGVESIRDRGFRYLNPRYTEPWLNAESGMLCASRAWFTN
jgi:hypothetical protein